MNAKSIVAKPVLRKAALWIVGIVVGIGVAGFLLAPPLARHFAQKTLSEALHRSVTIEDISINPYTMTAAVRGFAVKEPDGSAEALRFDELFVDLQAESLFRGGVVLREIRLDKPTLRLVRNQDGRYNYSDLIDEFLAKPKSEGETLFSLNNIRLTGGRIEFDDRPKKQRHEVSDIDIGVPFVSNLPSKVDIEVQPAFSAKVDGTPVALGGEAKPFKDTREATVELKVDQFEISKYVAYSPLPLPFKVPAGKLDTRLTAKFVQPNQGQPSLNVVGEAALKDFAVTDTSDGAVLTLPKLAVVIDDLDVFGGKAEIRSVALQQPQINLLRGADGRLTLLDLIPKAPAEAAAPAKEAAAAPQKPPFRYSVAEIKLDAARVDFRDEAVQPAYSNRVEPINVVVKKLGNAPGQSAEVTVELAASGGEQLRQTASFTLEPLAAKGEVELSGLVPAAYLPYYASMIRFKPASGKIVARTRYDLAVADNQTKLILEEIGVDVADLRLRQEGEKDDFYRLAAAKLSGGKLDLAQRSLDIQQLSLQESKLRLSREKDGKLSLEKLLPPPDKASAAKTVAPSASAEVPWTVKLGKLEFAAHDITFEDRVPPEPIRLNLSALSARIENLGTHKGAQPSFNLAARLNKRGSLKLAGTALLEPLSTKATVDLKDIDIVPFRPYFADKFNITLTGGAVSAKGKLAFEQPKGGAPRVKYQGTAGIGRLHTVDKANAADFLVWKSLFVDGIDLASVQPLKLAIKEVALSDFYSRLILNANGQLNVQQVMRSGQEEGATPSVTQPNQAPPAARSPPAEAKTDSAQLAGIGGAAESSPTPPAPAAATAAATLPAAAAPPPDYKITVGKVTLQGGNVNFSDFFIKPNYTADMKELGGSVTGLSSDLGTTADVELRGKVSDAPLEILGKVNPLSGNLFLDLKAAATGIELPQFSPYSGKYAGYAIEKGKLTVNLAYKVENRKLEAQNSVFLDQLTFGEKVDSPDATKLPVLLAVALLKNSRGEIDIKLPIGGSLDDPKFSVGGIIIQVIVNLIVKAVTAPFALLGSLFGGGEELAYAEFPPGRAAIVAPADKKLETLTKALLDRPGLKLEIAGRVDPEQDREGLKQASLERKVKAQKHAELTRKGEDVASVETLTVEKDEYPKYLELAYKQEKFPKPRNAIGLTKSLPPPEMEKLMLTHAEVSEEDLRLLANRRAQTVKDYLVNTGKVPQERVFLVAPKLGGEPPKDKGPASRVDFSLK